jgi:hypothetical protein
LANGPLTIAIDAVAHLHALMAPPALREADVRLFPLH